MLEAVKAEPEPVRQIDVELRRRDFKSAGIVCVAALHGQEWRLLGGSRAAPYQCTIGDRTLRIDAESTYFVAVFRCPVFQRPGVSMPSVSMPRGHRLGQHGRAPDNLLFERVKDVREGKFRCSWDP